MKEHDGKKYFKHCLWTKKIVVSKDSLYWLKSIFGTRSYRKAEAAHEAAKKNKVEDRKSIIDFMREAERENLTQYSINDVQLDEKEFLSLLLYMPNLTTVDVGKSKNAINYFTYLRDVNPNMLHVVDIPIHDIKKNLVQLHLSACYNFRQTLKRLQLRHWNYKYSIGDQTYFGLDFLQHFKNLTHLDFYTNLNKK